MATFKWDFSATCASVDLRFGRARMNGCMPCASSRRSTTDACMARMQAAGQQLCAQPDKSWPSRQVVARLRCAMQRLARSRTSKIAGRATGLFVRPLASARRGIALHGGPKSSRHGPWRGGCGKMYSSRSSVAPLTLALCRSLILRTMPCASQRVLRISVRFKPDILERCWQL